MRILGVDPGVGRTGLGVLDWERGKARMVHHEIFSPGSARGRREKRLGIIYRLLKQRIEQFKPDRVVLEDLFYHKNFRAAMRLSEARSMAMLAAAEGEVPLVEYTPARVKQAVCGNGRASKVQVAYMVRSLLGVREPLRPDESDALALALCHTHAENH